MSPSGVMASSPPQLPALTPAPRHMRIMTSTREHGRLDYLNSQEPGDSSQANAIHVVDGLLVEDDLQTPQISMDQISGTKSASTLGTKVAQCLAKRVKYSCSLEKAGVFDWVDSPDPYSCITGTVSKKKHGVDFKNQMKYLEPERFNGYGLGTRVRELRECIDKESRLNHLVEKSEPVSAAADDSHEEYDTGPNTQMAAEAMEALFNASSVSFDVRDNAHPKSSVLRIDSVKEIEINNISSVHSSAPKIICMPQSVGGMTTQYKQSKVDDTRLNGESSSALTRHPSKSTASKNAKLMTGKAKRSMDIGILLIDINNEEPKGTMGSGADDSYFPYLLCKNAVIHPKRRTYVFTSGNSKVEFSEASRSTALGAKATELMQLSIAKTVSLSDKNMHPDITDGMERKQRLSLTDQKTTVTSCTAASDGTLPTAIKDTVFHKEISHFNQVPGTLLSIGQEKHSASEDKVQDSSLTMRVPLRERNSAWPQSRMHTSNKPLKNVFSKSPGSRELASLVRNEPPPGFQSNRRRKRYMSTVRVLFSRSMDQETIKQQMKILTHFGVPVAITISEATHFVAKKFARTRNMLEAIAMGIPVVIPSWLECCGIAGCFIDEKKYILRDLKKEKELDFSMPVSLSRACQNPLLEGQRVLITPNAKPGKELLKSLVVAVHGQPLERINVSRMKNKNFKGAFVISVEEDYSICLPLIKNGLEVFDSELLLNGIVIQKLEFDRHRLFHGRTM